MLNRLKDVFAFLQRHDVRYVVIGEIAGVLHGVPRATFDLDLLIEATSDNAQRLLDALAETGMGTAHLTTAADLLAHEITIFQDRVRIDVQTSTPGLTFAEAWTGRVTMAYEGQQFNVVSRVHLIRSKRASGRDIDLQDASILETANPDAR